MPIESSVDRLRRRIVVRVVGEFTFADIRSAIDAALGHPDFEPGFDLFSDHTGVRRPISTEEAKQMASYLEGFADQLAGMRWAALAATPESYGKLRMVEMLLRNMPIEVQVFATRKEADAWLASPKG